LRGELFLEEILESPASVIGARYASGNGGRIGVGNWRGILLESHAKLEKLAGVAGVLSRNGHLDGLGTLKLRAAIEMEALLAGVELEFATGALAESFIAGPEDSAAIGAAGANDVGDHARRVRAEHIVLLGARLGRARLAFFFLFAAIFILIAPCFVLPLHRQPPKT
jgi:hypothetical protein